MLLKSKAQKIRGPSRLSEFSLPTLQRAAELALLQKQLQARLSESPGFPGNPQPHNIKLSYRTNHALTICVSSAIIRHKLMRWMHSVAGQTWLSELPVKHAPAMVQCRVMPALNDAKKPHRQRAKPPTRSVARDLERVAEDCDPELASVLRKLARRAERD